MKHCRLRKIPRHLVEGSQIKKEVLYFEAGLAFDVCGAIVNESCPGTLLEVTSTYKQQQCQDFK